MTEIPSQSHTIPLHSTHGIDQTVNSISLITFIQSPLHKTEGKFHPFYTYPNQKTIATKRGRSGFDHALSNFTPLPSPSEESHVLTAADGLLKHGGNISSHVIVALVDLFGYVEIGVCENDEGDKIVDDWYVYCEVE